MGSGLFLGDKRGEWSERRLRSWIVSIVVEEAARLVSGPFVGADDNNSRDLARQGSRIKTVRVGRFLRPEPMNERHKDLWMP